MTKMCHLDLTLLGLATAVLFTSSANADVVHRITPPPLKPPPQERVSRIRPPPLKPSPKATQLASPRKAFVQPPTLLKYKSGRHQSRRGSVVTKTHRFYVRYGTAKLELVLRGGVNSAQLLDFKGRPVRVHESKSRKDWTLRLDNPPSGNYTLKLTAGGRYSVKITGNSAFTQLDAKNNTNSGGHKGDERPSPQPTPSSPAIPNTYPFLLFSDFTITELRDCNVFLKSTSHGTSAFDGKMSFIVNINDANGQKH